MNQALEAKNAIKPWPMALQIAGASHRPADPVPGLGRHGQAGQGDVGLGRGRSQAACRTANRLAGNAPGAACLETVSGGLQLQSQGETVVAITGADAPLTLTTAQGKR